MKYSYSEPPLFHIEDYPFIIRFKTHTRENFFKTIDDNILKIIHL